MEKIKKNLSLLTSVIFMVTIYLADKSLITEKIFFKDLADKSLSTFLALTGVLLTVLSLLLSIKSDFIDELKQNKKFKWIISNLKMTLWLSIILSLLSGVVMTSNYFITHLFDSRPDGLINFVKILFIFFLVWSILKFIVFIQIFFDSISVEDKNHRD